MCTFEKVADRSRAAIYFTSNLADWGPLALDRNVDLSLGLREF
jgi:hypothetical protein